ncbi:MAG: cytochrome c biogenesis protein CcsA [Chloroflexota bacterium]|nr:cytochrome c biogenesis protein CcsA [Chloroflexota bacterium]
MAVTQSTPFATPTSHEQVDRLSTITRWLGWILVPGAVLALFMALAYAPAEATMGEVYRIFYFHLPANIASFILFFVAFVAGFAYLLTSNRRWDTWGAAGVEVGILASFIGTLTGSIWARPVWNTWWTWDPRLTTVTIMLLTYVGYMMLRGAVDDPERRARYSAIFAILAFVNVPLVYFSTKILDRTIHPVVFGGENPNAEGDMALTGDMHLTLLVTMIFGLLLFAYLLFKRVQLARREERVEQLRIQLLEENDGLG